MGGKSIKRLGSFNYQRAKEIIYNCNFSEINSLRKGKPGTRKKILVKLRGILRPRCSFTKSTGKSSLIIWRMKW